MYDVNIQKGSRWLFSYSRLMSDVQVIHYRLLPGRLLLLGKARLDYFGLYVPHKHELIPVTGDYKHGIGATNNLFP